MKIWLIILWFVLVICVIVGVLSVIYYFDRNDHMRAIYFIIQTCVVSGICISLFIDRKEILLD